MDEISKPIKIGLLGDSAFGEFEGFIGEKPGWPISRHIAAAQNLVINVPLCLLYFLTRLIALWKKLQYWIIIIEIRNKHKVKRGCLHKFLAVLLVIIQDFGLAVLLF